MLIDCDTCRMRNTSACDECVVPVLFGIQPVEIDEAERQALANLAEAGLCPPLRLVPFPQDPGTGRRARGA
jgi:hypothetical protein